MPQRRRSFLIASSEHSPTYRADIDGLRAIAVIAVVAFHAAPSFVPGGFVGVDVFFVISGFLITGLVVSSLQRGTFSYGTFIGRRIRRILPALTVVTAAVLLAGGLLLFPDDFRELGRDALASALFASNLVLFHRGSGGEYFAVHAELNPFIHLWSLGVEEQFYLFWPFALWFTARRDAKLSRLASVAWAIALASFALNVYLSYTRPSAAFYLPVSRIWELLAGGLLSIRQLSAGGQSSPRSQFGGRMADVVAAVGILAILAPLFALGPRETFPGFWALFPVLGTVLVIAAGPTAAINRWLATPVLVGIGLISYPLYLWHWPLLVFVRTVTDTQTTRSTLIAVGSSVVLAAVTYRMVELPLRRRDVRRVRWPLLGALAALGLIGACVRVGVVRPLVVYAAPQYAAATTDWGFHATLPTKLLGSKANAVAGSPDTTFTVAFIGDSHIEQYWPRIERLHDELVARHVHVEFLTHAGCPPLPLVNRTRNEGRECEEFARRAYAAVQAPNVRMVVIGAFWETYFLAPYGHDPGPADREKSVYYAGGPRDRQLRLDSPDGERVLAAFRQQLDTLSGLGKAVVVIGSNVSGWQLDPHSLAERRLSFGSDRASVSVPSYNAYVAPVLDSIVSAARAAGARVVDPVGFLCARGVCRNTDAAGVPLYKDGNHLRARVAATLTLIDSVLWGR